MGIRYRMEILSLVLLAWGIASCHGGGVVKKAQQGDKNGAENGGKPKVPTVRIVLPDRNALAAEWPTISSGMNAFLFSLKTEGFSCTQVGAVARVGNYKDLGAIDIVTDSNCDYTVNLELGDVANSALMSSLNRLDHTFYFNDQPYRFSGRDVKIGSYDVRSLSLAITGDGRRKGLATSVLTTPAPNGTTSNPSPNNNGVNNPNGANATNKVTYQGEVASLLQTYCISCHSPNGMRSQSDLTTYEGARNYGARIVQEVLASRMPLGQTLGQSEKDLFSAWQANNFAEAALASNQQASIDQTSTADNGVVAFHIAPGTGGGAWNNSNSVIRARVGQIVRFYNDDANVHQLHTNGAPCPHGPPILPGQSWDCEISQAYNGRPLYDHNTNGAVYIEAN